MVLSMQVAIIILKGVALLAAVRAARHLDAARRHPPTVSSLAVARAIARGGPPSTATYSVLSEMNRGTNRS